MTPTELRAAGEALYGERWKSPLAEAPQATKPMTQAARPAGMRPLATAGRPCPAEPWVASRLEMGMAATRHMTIEEPMTMSDEFADLARKTGLSDARLGQALGLSGKRENVAARVRQWKRGARPVPAEILSMLRALVAAAGGTPLPDDDATIAALAQDIGAPPEWIIGHAHDAIDPDEDIDDQEIPEWLVHTRRPRFVCRVVDEIEEGVQLGRLTYSDAGWALTNFLWFDPQPVGAALEDLLRRAMAAVGGRSGE